MRHHIGDAYVDDVECVVGDTTAAWYRECYGDAGYDGGNDDNGDVDPDVVAVRGGHYDVRANCDAADDDVDTDAGNTCYGDVMI